MIKKSGDKWALYSADGKNLIAKHDTRAQALAQEQAIAIAKKKEQTALS